MPKSYFNANFECAGCGNAELASVMTKIESDAGSGYRVGSKLNVSIADMLDSHDTVRLPDRGESMHILESWRCTRCGRGRQWVEVVVDNGIVRAIDQVRFDPTTLDRIHFVTNMIVEFYEDMTGEAYYLDQQVRPDWKERLRPHLS